MRRLAIRDAVLLLATLVLWVIDARTRTQSGASGALLLEVIPRDTTSGVVALTLTALGVFATIILEFPAAFRVARGAALPSGAAFVSSRPNVA